MEELFWRSFIMRWIDRADFSALSPVNISTKALFISSILFASEHSYWFAGLVAGLVYGLLYIRTQNLWAPVIAHAVTNGVLGVWVLYTGHWNYW
ncbi:MAG: CAAX prenyl protease-related protein [Methylococcaceae bacterium]|nr:CAAX prenyl protease-related protein [Methylococcaceae bacterium]